MQALLRVVSRTVLVLGTLWLGKVEPSQAQEIDGDWQGAVEVLGQQLPFVVHFTNRDGTLAATIDIQGATNLPLQNVSYEPPAVRFELQAGLGLAVWEGERTGDSVSGTFQQGGISGTFAMALGTTEVEVESEPAEPLPYLEEEIEFANGEIKLAGTLTIPEGTGPFPAVVMITGSGPQNRDEELFAGYKPFRTIADHLTRQGIAVLRYDDRGVGGSTGSVNDATSADFADDVVQAVTLLQSRPEIAPERVGVLGHSEGGIVGPLAATKTDGIAFVVMLAGPAYSGEQILYQQGELIVRVEGGDDDDAALQRQVQELMFAAIRTDRGWDSVRTVVRTQVVESLEEMTSEQRAAITDTDAFISQRVEAAVQGVRTPWFKFFIDYDPVPALEQLQVPVLALFGEFDLQVPAQLNHDAMQGALERSRNPDVTLEILPGVNHLFLPTETGKPSEYQTMDKEFPPGFLERISDWIATRFGV